MNSLFRDAPARWRSVRLKQTVVACTAGVWGEEARGDAGDVVCVRVADFDRLRLRTELPDPTLRFIPPGYRRGRMLAAGDLLLEKSGGGDGQPVGAVVLYASDSPAVCSNFIARMPVAQGFDPRYLCYLHAACRPREFRIWIASLISMSLFRFLRIRNSARSPPCWIAKPR
jgi:type I restriction enzyme S subunit